MTRIRKRLDNPNVLTTKEACEALGCSRNTLIKWYQMGKIRSGMYNGLRYYDRKDVDKLRKVELEYAQ